MQVYFFFGGGEGYQLSWAQFYTSAYDSSYKTIWLLSIVEWYCHWSVYHTWKCIFYGGGVQSVLNFILQLNVWFPVQNYLTIINYWIVLLLKCISLLQQNCSYYSLFVGEQQMSSDWTWPVVVAQGQNNRLINLRGQGLKSHRWQFEVEKVMNKDIQYLERNSEWGK